MKKFNENFFKLQGFYFRIIGFDILSGNHIWFNPWKTFWSMISLGVMHFMMAAYVLQNFEDVEKVADGLACMLNNNLGLFKFGLIIWLHKDIRHIIEQLQKILIAECQAETTTNIILQQNRNEQRISTFYSNCFVFAGFSSCIKPIMAVGLFYVMTGEVHLEINVPCAYPWDNRKWYNFLISWALLSAASFGVVFPTVCIDTLIVLLIYNLVALYKIAQHKIQFIAGETLQDSKDRLHDILHLYKVTLDISDTLNRYFRLLFCIQLMMASIHLCVISFTLSISLAQSQMLFYVVLGIAILVQLFLYCQCGEYLKTESRQFARAIYDSPWYEASVINPSIGRSIQIAMMRAQRGTQLDGYFFKANMEAFLSIVMKASSYFTLLRSLS